MTTEVLTYGLSYLNFMHFHLFSIFMAYVLDVTTWVFVFLTLGPKKLTAVFCNKGYILKPCICGGILYIYMVMHHLMMFWSTGRAHIQWWSHKIIMEMKKFLSPRDILAIVAEFLTCLVTLV